MLGSGIEQITHVSVEGTGKVMAHLAARWTEFSSHARGQTAHKDDTVDSYCTASSSKEHVRLCKSQRVQVIHRERDATEFVEIIKADALRLKRSGNVIFQILERCRSCDCWELWVL